MITLAIIPMRPSALIWVLAAAVAVVLYLRCIPPPQVTVARPYLWRQVLGDPRSLAGSWQRRRIMSAAIQVVVILLLVFASLDLCLRQPRTVVFVVDNSWSMKAVAENGDRLASAQALIRQHLDKIGPREYAAVVTTAGQPVVVSPAEQNLQRVAGAIDRIHAVDLPSHMMDAIDLASLQAAPGTRVEVHVFSDGCFDGEGAMDLPSTAIVHPLGSDAGNAAVTRIAVRRYPNDSRRLQVMVDVTNRSNAALDAPLQILVNDKPVHQSECRVGPDSTATVTVDLESEAAGPLAALLGRPDSLPADNRLETVLPEAIASDASVWPGFPSSHLAGRQICDTRSPGAWLAVEAEPIAYRVTPLWPPIVVAALVLLVLEWALFHRRWTC